MYVKGSVTISKFAKFEKNSAEGNVRNLRLSLPFFLLCFADVILNIGKKHYIFVNEHKILKRGEKKYANRSQMP